MDNEYSNNKKYGHGKACCHRVVGRLPLFAGSQTGISKVLRNGTPSVSISIIYVTTPSALTMAARFIAVVGYCCYCFYFCFRYPRY